MPITEKTPIWLDLKKEYIDDNFAKLQSYLRSCEEKSGKDTFYETTIMLFRERIGDLLRECLGTTLEKYFLTGFWKDHLARYQKRPIYWLFQSNKKNPAFQVLVYMHRMDAYSCEKVRTYLLTYIDYQKQRINQLELNVDALSPAETRQLIKMKGNLTECLSYEERLHHVANQQIAFDLDDSVKVNYAKFGDVLATIN